MAQVSAKTFMESVQENRQRLGFMASVLGMLLLFFLCSMDSARISLLTPIRPRAFPHPCAWEVGVSVKYTHYHLDPSSKFLGYGVTSARPLLRQHGLPTLLAAALVLGGILSPGLSLLENRVSFVPAVR